MHALGSFGASATWTELPLLELVGSHPRRRYATQGILVMLLGCCPCCLFNPSQQHAHAAQEAWPCKGSAAGGLCLSGDERTRSEGALIPGPIRACKGLTGWLAARGSFVSCGTWLLRIWNRPINCFEGFRALSANHRTTHFRVWDCLESLGNKDRESIELG